MRTIPTLAAALLVGAAAGAQQEADPEVEVRIGTGRAVQPADEIVGTNVINEARKTLGTVEDLVIHPNGQIAFVVLLPAGWTGIENRLIPVAYGALRYDTEQGVFVLPGDEGDLENAKRFRTNEWPRSDDMEFWTKAARHFEELQHRQATPVEAAAKLAPAKRLFRYEELGGRTIETPGGDEIGQIRAIALDRKVGRVSFVVIGAGGFLGSGEKLVAVPWTEVEAMPDEQDPEVVRLTLSTTKERLEGAPEFRAGRAGWEEQANDPEWLVRLYQFYGKTPYWNVDVEVETPPGND